MYELKKDVIAAKGALLRMSLIDGYFEVPVNLNSDKGGSIVPARLLVDAITVANATDVFEDVPPFDEPIPSVDTEDPGSGEPNKNYGSRTREEVVSAGEPDCAPQGEPEGFVPPDECQTETASDTEEPTVLNAEETPDAENTEKEDA